MSENNKTTPQSEEVDLGQLFKVIGQLFKDLFNFFTGIFKGLFRTIIYALKPLVNNIRIISIILLLAAISGFLLEKYSKPVYYSDMLVRPNFDSKYQLVDNIDYFNALIAEKNLSELSRVFEIDSIESSELLAFKIEIGPHTKNDLVIEYDLFLKSIIDSTLASSITYDNFIENRDVLNGSTFKITAESSTKYIFGKLEKGFNKTFENNYSKKNKMLRDSSIVIEKRKLLRDLKRVDSIQKIYLQVLETDSEKQSVILPSGAFPVSQERIKTREYDLLQEEFEIRDQLKSLDEKQITESDFYDILSSFEEIGRKKEKSFFLKYKFLFPSIALSLIILLFSLYKMFYFVKDYE